MGNFQRNDRSGGRGGFRGGDRGGRQGFGGGRGGARGPVTMYKAVCDKCHKECEVPFLPSQDKPIYCNECFSGKKEGGDRGDRRDFRDRGPRKNFNERPMQSPSTNRETGVSDEIKKQLSEMNNKLDRLASAIENLSISKTPTPKVKETPKTVKASVKKVAPKAKVKKVVTKKKK